MSETGSLASLAPITKRPETQGLQRHTIGLNSVLQSRVRQLAPTTKRHDTQRLQLQTWLIEFSPSVQGQAVGPDHKEAQYTEAAVANMVD